MTTTVLEQQTTFRTPDGTNFSVVFLDKGQTEAKLNISSFTTASEEFQLNNGHEILIDVSNFELVEIFPDGSSYLFTQENFKLYAAGEYYWHTSIFLERDNFYVSYNLEPSKAVHFLNGAKPLPDYKSFERHIAYMCADNAVIFVAHRINELYDGYWYPTLDDFEYSYRSFAY
ncbi:MAG: hypothetical protein EOP48_21785 [Sphingobacteriales bacterium]|nr:MAG: hypothetical protein EOP48_21785 [Sphingobacteriales bacterium]